MRTLADPPVRPRDRHGPDHPGSRSPAGDREARSPPGPSPANGPRDLGPDVASAHGPRIPTRASHPHTGLASAHGPRVDERASRSRKPPRRPCGPARRGREPDVGERAPPSPAGVRPVAVPLPPRGVGAPGPGRGSVDGRPPGLACRDGRPAPARVCRHDTFDAPGRHGIDATALFPGVSAFGTPLAKEGCRALEARATSCRRLPP